MTNWQQWCRLCSKDDVAGNVNVFFKNEEYLSKNNDGCWNNIGSTSLAAAIGRFFWVNITRDDDLPKTICSDCLSLVAALVEFSDRTVKVQKLFCMLQSAQSSNVVQSDLHELRAKCGLLNMQEQQVSVPFSMSKESRQAPAEVYYLDEKPKINDDFEDLMQLDEVENPLTPQIKCETNNGEDSNSLCEGNSELVADPIQTDDEEEEEEEDANVTKLAQKEKTYNGKQSKMNELSSVRTSSLTVRFECSECPRKFRRGHHYTQHMNRQHQQEAKIKPLPCQVCQREFHTEMQLERHKKVHLPMEKKRVLPCAFCDRKFTSNWLVQSHIKHIHNNERPFICEECGAAVRTNAALKSHMLVHTDLAPFECDICKKCFKSEIRLRVHKETHGPNKHICSECGLQLNSRATLNRHLLVHSDEMDVSFGSFTLSHRPSLPQQHKCDYCGRQFKRVKALKNHLILHTGLKPYSCDFCDRTFANGSNCRTHKKKAHPVELAAQEATTGAKTYTRNIPKLDTLKAITKNKDNLSPVVSKQSGRFAFGKKPPPLSKANERKTANTSTVVDASQTTISSGGSIPTIDNIYKMMKQATQQQATPISTELKSDIGQNQDHSTSIEHNLYAQVSNKCQRPEQELQQQLLLTDSVATQVQEDTRQSTTHGDHTNTATTTFFNAGSTQNVEDCFL